MKTTNFCASGAAILLLTLPLLDMPLAFFRLTGRNLSLFGTVTLPTIPVCGLIALATLIIFHRRSTAMLKESRTLRILAVSGAAILLSALINLLLRRNAFLNMETALFYAALPQAAAVLKEEMRKFLPPVTALGTVLFLWSGLASWQFTGLTGNWNWTTALLTAGLPGVLMMCKVKKHLLLFTLAAAALFLTAVLIYSRQIFSFALLIAVLATVPAAAAMLLIPEKLRRKGAAIIVCAAFLLFIMVIAVTDLPLSRIQMWKGALGLFSDNLLYGIGGAYNFPELVPPFLPVKYFFSSFAAPLHLHAHNEFLNLCCSYGIAGAVYFITLFSGMYGAVRKRTFIKRELFLPLWTASIILICGQLDLTAFIACGAVWSIICATLVICQDTEAAAMPPDLRLLPGGAAVMLMIYAAGETTASLRAASELRRGQMCVLKGELSRGVKHYENSCRIRASRHSLYELAEIELKRNRPASAFALLFRLEEELGSSNYLHANRIKSVALFKLGQPQKALEFLRKDMTNYPASIINARLHLVLLQLLKQPPSEIAKAQKEFDALCALRKVSPQKALLLTPQQDDSSEPNKVHAVRIRDF